MRSRRLVAVALLSSLLASACALDAGETLGPMSGFDAEEEDIGASEETIIGGGDASEGEYPFAVRLTMSGPNGTFGCGGTLVASRYVLTAAHCVTDTSRAGLSLPGEVTTIIGRTKLSSTSTGETRMVAAVIAHPRYDQDPGFVSNDVALLRLSSPSTFAPISIASPYGPGDRRAWTSGANVTAIGWGMTACGSGQSDALQELSGTIQSDVDMQALTSSFSPDVHVGFDGLAAGQAIYKGDSGGPLLAQTAAGLRVVGVTSWTIGCGENPQMFTRVGAQQLHRWIKTVIHETPAVGDVDGDGKDDIVTITHGDSSTGPLDVYVALSDGAKFGAASVWQDWWAHRGHIPMVGDFDGDGKDDLWAFTDDGVWVALSTGSSFNGAIYDISGITSRGEVPRIGDVDGDGKKDVVIFTGGDKGDVYVMRSTGSGFGPKQKAHEWFAPDGETPMLADVNGDGKDDILTFTQGMYGNRVFVALSNGTTFGASALWHDNFARSTEMPGVGRFDAGNEADIVTFTRNSLGYAYVGLSSGSTGFGVSLWHTSFGDNHSTLLTGDFNGDSRDDIVQFTQDVQADVFVALSNGSGFGARTSWHGYFAP